MKPDGFSLVEVLVATALVVIGIVSLAQLFGTSADRISSARAATLAVLFAEQKLEQIRAQPEGPAPSPPGALLADTPGYVDYVDGRGVSFVDAVTSPPVLGLYTRRWSVEPISGTEAVVLQVLVIPGAVRFVTVKTRRTG
jgi:type II secretory pathway pseudopilin PulG